MRLFLSSENIAKEEELAKLIGGKNKRVAIVVNTSDWRTADERKKRLDNEVSNLNEAGFMNNYELDIREYADGKDKLAESLRGTDLIWVRGGNTFYLRWIMERTGFDKLLIQLLNDDALAYGGYSAGAVIAAPTLRGLECFDSISIAPETIWEGLNIIDFSIIPHWGREDCKHKTSAMKKCLEDLNIPFRTLRDGEVIIVDGDKEYKI
jgi:dipeptidase E